MFSYPPMSFLAHFEVNQEVFGSDLYDAIIYEGILIIVSSNRTMKLFSFDAILENYMTDSLKIGENYQNRGVIGEAPLGFPVNVKIEEQPPVLFSINCHDYDVTFSDFVPRLCITTAKDYCYKVRKVIMIFYVINYDCQ